MKLTLTELKVLLQTLDVEAALALKANESRTGALKLIDSRIKAIEKMNLARARYQEALHYETLYAGEVVCGIDEVGRGPLAGPVVACAAVLNHDHDYLGLTDSKKLSAKMRASLDVKLRAHLADFAIGSASPEEIDRYNIYEATKLAMTRAVAGLTIKPAVLLIDAMTLNTGLIEENIIKGDEKSLSISAASVLAKEYRDQLMKQYDELYPGYDFKHNAGYGTKKHLEGLKTYGISPIHRRSFEPVKSMTAF